ncbi:MAG TPA: peroxiredoxin [Acidimicrobiales bacterium]|nr:peroxiredoxin [Acidimicrobiales bacterium]
MRKNDLAPDFSLLDQDGSERTLSTLLLDGTVVLFFYPAALSPGCTKESCHFRDRGAEFTHAGAHLVGVSMDAPERQAQFALKHGLHYPLLADVDGVVARLYGVKRSLSFLKVKRATFVIDRHRRILEVITSEVSMNAHADRALATLRAQGD